MNEQHPLWKPKFILTAFAMASATLLRVADLLGPGEWVTVINLSLGTYATASVVENKVLK